MMVLVEDEKYINPIEVGYVEKLAGSGSKAIIQGKEVSFRSSPKQLVQLINSNAHSPAGTRQRSRD